jgi:hypothetical protein
MKSGNVDAEERFPTLSSPAIYKPLDYVDKNWGGILNLILEFCY